MQRVLREQVQNIREQQFLVLLFVVAAEFDQFGDGRRKIVLHQRSHRAIDMLAIRVNRIQSGTRDHAASGARLTGADALVIGVEQEIELRIEHAIAAKIRLENHFLEEPRRMREVPFCRACVGHRLHGRVGVGKWRA